MNRCSKCDMIVNTSSGICPLCNSKLEDKTNRSIFPNVKPNYKGHNLLIKITLLISLWSIIITSLINYLVNKELSWSIFVSLGILSFWLTFIRAIKKRKDFMILLFTEISSLIILAILWDINTGFHKWSLIFVLPFLCICYTFVFLIFRIFTNKIRKDYIMLTYLNCLIGIIPLYFILTKKFKILLPSYISVCVSILGLIFLFIFNHKTIGNEMERRLHI